MRKDKYKIQVGDKLYEASKSYHKVFEWEVLDIWLEAYISGYKTIVKCSNGTWTKEFFCADVFEFYDTHEEAEKALNGGVSEGKTDVIEVVRCKDCTFSNYSNYFGGLMCDCGHGLIDVVKEDYFCSYGERKV